MVQEAPPKKNLSDVGILLPRVFKCSGIVCSPPQTKHSYRNIIIKRGMAEETPEPAPANRMAPPASKSTSSSMCASSSSSSSGKSSWPGLALLLRFRLDGGRLRLDVLESDSLCPQKKSPLSSLPVRPSPKPHTPLLQESICSCTRRRSRARRETWWCPCTYWSGKGAALSGWEKTAKPRPWARCAWPP